MLVPNLCGRHALIFLKIYFNKIPVLDFCFTQTSVNVCFNTYVLYHLYQGYKNEKLYQWYELTSVLQCQKLPKPQWTFNMVITLGSNCLDSPPSPLANWHWKPSTAFVCAHNQAVKSYYPLFPHPCGCLLPSEASNGGWEEEENKEKKMKKKIENFLGNSKVYF